MREARIHCALRTAIGAHGGALASVRPDDLAALVLKAVAERSGVDLAQIDDVILGCANQSGEDNRNVARMASLLAGFPIEVPGQTVNRLCASGLQAVASAAQAIRAGEGDVFLAGGVESMTRAPFVLSKSEASWDRRPPMVADTTVGWRFVNPKMPAAWTVSLGETAEIVAKRYGITREEQEEFALASQQKTARAVEEGAFEDEIVPVEVDLGKKGKRVVDRDEHPRPGLTRDDVTRLRPAFRKDGTVTAATSSGINDGAAALLVVSEGCEAAATLGPARARIVASAVAGVDPSCMGMGPVPATRKVLERSGLRIEDLDLVELNEAFAAQALACIRELALDPDRVNVHGGAIALGHPLGCTGARMVVTLVHALERHRKRYGLATLCIGVGQGMALIVERLER